MPQSLFTSQIPVSLDAADGADSYSMGSYITPAVPGTVTHIRWPFPFSGQPGGEAVKANVFRNSDQAKLGGADAVFVSPGTPSIPGTPATPSWNLVALNTPAHFNAFETFCATIRTPLRYVASVGGASPWPLTNGDLSATAGVPGRFISGASGNVDFPTNAFNNGCYFVDVVFVPDGEDEDRTTSGTASATASATATRQTVRVTAGVAAALSAARQAISSARLTAGVARAVASTSASRMTARTTAGSARAVAAGGTYAPLVGPGPLLRTSSRPVLLSSASRKGYPRTVTSTTIAK